MQRDRDFWLIEPWRLVRLFFPFRKPIQSLFDSPPKLRCEKKRSRLGKHSAKTPPDVFDKERSRRRRVAQSCKIATQTRSRFCRLVETKCLRKKRCAQQDAFSVKKKKRDVNRFQGTLAKTASISTSLDVFVFAYVFRSRSFDFFFFPSIEGGRGDRKCSTTFVPRHPVSGGALQTTGRFIGNCQPQVPTAHDSARHDVGMVVMRGKKKDVYS